MKYKLKADTPLGKQLKSILKKVQEHDEQIVKLARNIRQDAEVSINISPTHFRHGVAAFHFNGKPPKGFMLHPRSDRKNKFYGIDANSKSGRKYAKKFLKVKPVPAAIVFDAFDIKPTKGDRWPIFALRGDYFLITIHPELKDKFTPFPGMIQLDEEEFKKLMENKGGVS